MIIACFQSQVNALPSLLVDDSGFSDSDSVGDPLSPSQLGESMDMPLPQELILEAKRAGIITKSNSYYKSDSEQPGLLGA